MTTWISNLDYSGMWPYKACLRPRRPVHGLRRLAMNWVESFNLGLLCRHHHHTQTDGIQLISSNWEPSTSWSCRFRKGLGSVGNKGTHFNNTQCSLYNDRLEHFYGGEGNNSTPWQEPYRDTSAPREGRLPLTARSFVVSIILQFKIENQ